MRFILLFLICCVSACSGAVFQKSKVTYIPQSQSTAQVQHHSPVKKKLLSQYNEWKGTRYREGGSSKKGVDCSGFVQITYRSKLGIDVPRTIEQQIRIGRSITRSNLQTGDLVFFKTGLFSRHVGMYLGGSRFLHVSSARGVTISSLKENYWNGSYWLAKRIKM